MKKFILIILAFAQIGCLFAQSQSYVVHNTGKVGYLQARQAPNGKVLDKIPEGTTIQRIGTPGIKKAGYEWVKVKYKGKEVFVANEYLQAKKRDANSVSKPPTSNAVQQPKTTVNPVEQQAVVRYWAAGNRINDELVKDVRDLILGNVRAFSMGNLFREAAQKLKDTNQKNVDIVAIRHAEAVQQYWNYVAGMCDGSGYDAVKEAVKEAIGALATGFVDKITGKPIVAKKHQASPDLVYFTEEQRKEIRGKIDKLEKDEKSVMDHLMLKYEIKKLEAW